MKRVLVTGKIQFHRTKCRASKERRKTEVDVINVPSAVQSVVSVQNITTLKMKDPQYFAATLANYILGGGGEARLFMNLREKNGFTYGAYSSFDTSKYSPSFRLVQV